MGVLESVALALAYPSPELVWGIVSRGIGLTYLISYASLSVEVVAIAGASGVFPVRETLALMGRHFPTWKRFFYFPTLLWVDSGDATLRALPWLGMVASLLVVVGGPAAPFAMGACYLIYLTLDRAMILIYPWDCLLFEAGLWGAFLPSTHVMPDVSAVSAPNPAVAWVFRLLVFRVMLGFGKQKFVGATPDDSGYLKGFFVNQPLPTPIGWFLQKLPIGLLKPALGFMFFVEIPLPFAVFFPGYASALGGVLVIVLMLAIWGAGTFGYFNIAMLAVTLSWFDTRTARAFSFHDVASQHPVIGVLVLLHTLASLVSFPFNTFSANTWTLWQLWERLPGVLTWPITAIRAIYPFRTVHAYGVFPPKPPPPLRIAAVMEESWDGVEWFSLEHAVTPTLETTPPRFCAPRHRRLDQAAVYEPLGLTEESLFRVVAGRWDPYGHSGVSGASMLMRAVLEGRLQNTVLYDGARDRARGAPLVARVRAYCLEPTSFDEMRSTGKWWKRTLVGPHVPPRRKGDRAWDHPFPVPELFHFEDLRWTRRSHLGGLMDRALRGEDPHALVLIDVDGVTLADRDRFWSDFVPRVASRSRHEWSGIRKTVDELRDRYDRRELYAFERLVGRYALFLFAKLEPLFLEAGIAPLFGAKKATFDAKSHYHLRLVTHHVVGDGLDAYDHAMREPLVARDALASMTMASGHLFQVLFRYEAVVFQSQKLRILDAYTEFSGRRPPTEKQREGLARFDDIARHVFGALDAADFMKKQFTTEDDQLDCPENLPSFRIAPDGSVERVT